MGCVGGTATGEAPVSRRRLSVGTGNTQVTAVQEGETADMGQGVVSKMTLDELFAMFPERSKRFSVNGENDSLVHKEFSDKKEHVEGKMLPGIGHCCRKGLKPEAPNQDDFLMIQSGTEFGLYAVFDGHGPTGHEVASTCVQHHPAALVRSAAFPSKPAEALKQSIIGIHRAISGCHALKVYDAQMSGATATSALILKDEETGKHTVHIAHCGDSRCILAKGKKWEGLSLAFETVDHKADLPEERKRIEANNGVVRRRKGDVPHRVFMRGSQLPGLAMSRSVGDLLAAKVGVSHVPDVSSIELTEEHQLLIMCSDGVWEFLSSDDVLDEITKFPRDKIQRACEHVAKLSWSKWVEVEGDVVDDITVIAVDLEALRGLPRRSTTMSPPSEGRERRPSKSREKSRSPRPS